MRGRRARQSYPPHQQEGRTASAACRRGEGPGRACPTHRAAGRSNRARSRCRRGSARGCPTTRARPAQSPRAGTRRSRDNRDDRAPSTRPRSPAARRRRRGCPARMSGRWSPIRYRRYSRPPSVGRRRYGIATHHRAGSLRHGALADQAGRRSPGRRSRWPAPPASLSRCRRSVCVVWRRSMSPSKISIRALGRLSLFSAGVAGAARSRGRPPPTASSGAHSQVRAGAGGRRRGTPGGPQARRSRRSRPWRCRRFATSNSRVLPTSYQLCRSASVGCTRSARRAGAAHASTPTAAMMTDVSTDEMTRSAVRLSARHARSTMRLLPARMPPPS